MGVPRLLIVVLLGWATACATSGGARDTPRRTIEPPSDLDHARVAALRTEAMRAVPAQAEAIWSTWIDETSLAPTVVGIDLLPSDRGAIERVAHAAPVADAPHLRALERWVVGELLAQATRDAVGRLTASEQGAPFSYEGKTYAFGQLRGLLAGEADPDRRRALGQAAQEQVAAEVAAAQAAWAQASGAAARQLGYSSFVEGAAAVRGMRPAQIAALAGAALEATDEVHADAFGALVQRILETPLDEMREVDVPRLRWGLQVASRIRADAGAALETTLEGLGLGELGIGIERVEGMPPLALAVDPPTDVRLALPVRDPDWARVLEQAGAAVHAALLPAAPFEARQLASPAISRAFGHLFASLAAEPAWLREHTELTTREVAGQVEAVAARQLWSVRRQGGGLLAAVEDEEDGRRALERAMGYRVDAGWHTLETDVWLVGADALRGQILGAMIEEHLIELHGPTWWREPAAGETLQSLARAGAGTTPEEFARALGARSLDADALARTLARRLK